MNILIGVVLLAFFLAALWGPSGLVILFLWGRKDKRAVRLLCFTWPLQLVSAAALLLVADVAGLENPGGLLLAAIFGVSLGGTLILLLNHARRSNIDT